jgi:hypothetical protein
VLNIALQFWPQRCVGCRFGEALGGLRQRFRGGSYVSFCLSTRLGREMRWRENTLIGNSSLTTAICRERRPGCLNEYTLRRHRLLLGSTIDTTILIPSMVRSTRPIIGADMSRRGTRAVRVLKTVPGAPTALPRTAHLSAPYQA